MDWMDYFDHAFGLIVVIPFMIYLLNRYFPAIMDEEVDFITLLIKDFEKFDFSFYQHNDKYFDRYTREKNRKLTSESEIYVHNCWNYKEESMISILFSFKKR